MKRRYNNLAKRILSFILVLCFAILPLGSAFSIVSKAQGSVDASKLELNGATVLNNSNKYLKTNSYVTLLDNGFDLSKDYTSDLPLSNGGTPTQFVSFYIDTLGDGGSILKGKNQKNGYDAYGFVAGSGEDVYDKDENGNDVLVGKSSIAIKLKYNYNKTTNIMGRDGNIWDISNDSWKSTVNGMSSVGLIGKGAVIVQKFVPTDEKPYPVAKDDWKRLNQFSGKETDGLHTVDFFNHYSPENHQSPFNVYTPSGDDLQKGVYVKITVAYELVRTYNGDGWWIFGGGEKKEYKNVLEETTFYLCNTSNEVVFTNLYFETKDEGDESDTNGTAQTGVESKGGAISNNQGAKEGFRVDINGWNYDVSYHFNGSTNALPCVDGQIFLDTGKYEFVIRSGINVIRRKTVYIHEKTIDKNLEVYFGSGLVSEDSIRVFAPSETYPVYVADTVTLKARNDDGGLIKHAPLVGKVYHLGYNEWDDMEKVERDENGLPKNGLIAEKSANQREWSITDLPTGNYEAVFYNNEEYFNGTATGDTYKFVWRFTLIEKGLAPMVNNELLYEQIGFSDFKAEHYVASLPTKGEGRLLCVFQTYNESYDFACRYYASTVSQSEDKFIFDNVAYDTEAEMLTALREKAKTIVEKRYFDANDVNTYITIKDDIITPVLGENPTEEDKEYYDSFIKALDREISYDVLVFTDDDAKYDMAAGLPYLNDRVHAYLDESGLIKVEKSPVYFISVADFESNSVVIKLKDSDISYPIPYGIPVQAYLEGLKAPSGIYTIVEANTYTTTEYDAVYISPGDIKTEITIERVYNNSLITQTLDKRDNGARIRANNFKITDIFNELDGYGLLKINKNGEQLLKCQIDDLESIPVIDEEGSYEIILVDRLGNQLSFFVDIYTSKKIYSFSLVNGENAILTEKAFGGKEFTLPALESANEKLTFIGWKDENGVIYNDLYTFNSPRDVTLEAVYHYSSVEINVYDGELIDTVSGNVGKISMLPEIKRDGYLLFGYRYMLEDGTIRFYREQITSVPNVEAMRLDAIWIKAENPDNVYAQGRGENVEISLTDGNVYHQITIQRDGKTPLPILNSEKELDFVGWIYQYKLTGMIFTDELIYNDVKKIGISDENTIILTSAWIASEKSSDAEGTTESTTESTDEGKQETVMLPVGSVSSGGGYFGGTGAGTGSSSFGSTNGTIAFAVSLLVASFMLLLLALRGKIKGLVSIIAQKINQARNIGELNTTYDEESCDGYTLGISIRRRLSKILISAICIILCVITLVGPQTTLISYAAEALNESIDEHVAEKEQKEAIEQEVQIMNDTLAKVEDTLGEDKLTDIQEFLYSSVLIDLYCLGYTEIFPAYAIVGENTPDTSDDKTVYGIGYTAYVDAYEENGKVYFGAGFVSFPENGAITTEDAEKGVIVRVSDEVSDDFVYTDFKLTANQTIYPSHYVAYEHYTYYQVSNYVVQSTTIKDEGVYLDIYGDVFSYDINEYCHFVNYGSEFDFDAYSIDVDVDYELMQKTYMDAISLQYSNGINVVIEQADFISAQALNDYVAHNQDESFLGVDADTLLYYEASIGDSYYYVVFEDGSVQPLRLPDDPAKKASLWERIAMGVATIGVAIAGIAICVASTTLKAIGVGVALGAVGGALIGAAVDMFVQVSVFGTPVKDVDYKSVAVSAISGAISGAIGTGVGAAANAVAKSSMKAALKVASIVGMSILAGTVGGMASYLTTQIVYGKEITFKDCMIAAGQGALISVIAVGASSVASAICSIKTASTIAYVVAQAIAGAVTGFASYLLSIAITGQEFSWTNMWLSVGISTFMAASFALGGKIVYNRQTAQMKRANNSSEPDVDVDESSRDYRELEQMMTTDDGLDELMKKYPDKAEKWKKAIDKYQDVINSDSLDITTADKEKASRGIKIIKGKILEEAAKDMLIKKGFSVQQSQQAVQGDSGLTYPDIVATNVTDGSIELFGQTINAGETVVIECKAGTAAYLKRELLHHIPNQLSGHGKSRSFLLTTSDIDGVDPSYLEVLGKTGTTHTRLDISAEKINNALMNYGGK